MSEDDVIQQIEDDAKEEARRERLDAECDAFIDANRRSLERDFIEDNSLLFADYCREAYKEYKW